MPSVKQRLSSHLADLLASLLKVTGQRTYQQFANTLWERHPFGETADSPLDVQLHCPDSVSPSSCDIAVSERVLAAYRSAKRAQEMADPRLRPSGGWRYVTDTAYAPLGRVLLDDEPEPFHYFLANFRNWQLPTGIDESHRIHKHATDATSRQHYERRVVGPLVQWWLRTQSDGRDVSALTIPDFGNASGALVDGHLVSVGSIFAEIHGRLVANLVPPGRPLIAELGGGFGRLLYFISRNLDRFCYIGFDLPETLCFASFFLLRAFPEKRFLFFDEAELTPQSLEEYDFILRPSFEMTRLPDRCVQLFINENSLGAISAKAATLYIAEICRITEQFWHRNHEVWRNEFDNGERSLVNGEYPIPPESFERVTRYCDIGTLMREGRIDYLSDMFWYHYRRRAT